MNNAKAYINVNKYCLCYGVFSLNMTHDKQANNYMNMPTYFHAQHVDRVQVSVLRRSYKLFIPSSENFPA
jgi:hypothetical protein